MSANVMNSTEATSRRGSDLLRQIIVLLVTIGTIVVNGLAVSLPLNGKSTGEISDSFPVLFTPAGYVFSIWSLIYAGLIAYSIYQVLPAQRENPRLRSIGWLYVVSGIANSVWIFLWHYEQFALTVVVMLVLLISLILIYLRLAPSRRSVSRAELWTTHIPFSVYLGWITVATVANVTTLLYFLGWNGGGIAPELWAIIMIGVATLLGLIFALREKDVAYVAVLVWAFIGIYVKQSATPTVAWTALILAVVLAIAAAVGVVQGRRAGQAQPAPQETV